MIGNTHLPTQFSFVHTKNSDKYAPLSRFTNLWLEGVGGVNVSDGIPKVIYKIVIRGKDSSKTD
jgi:hypothetical protein